MTKKQFTSYVQVILVRSQMAEGFAKKVFRGYV